MPTDKLLDVDKLFGIVTNIEYGNRILNVVTNYCIWYKTIEYGNKIMNIVSS